MILLLIPIAVSFYTYLYTKNYEYVIETPCDPSVDTCFTRDCTIVDECPPNGYSNYKQFYVNAADFAKCTTNSCEKECSEKLIECTPIPCGELEDDFCTTKPL